MSDDIRRTAEKFGLKVQSGYRNPAAIRKENADLTERNRQLETALRELVEAARGLADHIATLSTADVGSHVFDDIASDIKEIADHAAANNLLTTPKGEDDAA